MQIYYTHLPSPVGQFLVAGTERAVHRTAFHTEPQDNFMESSWRQDPVPITYAIEQFKAYFDGDLQVFSLSYEMVGTEFQRSVWEALKNIPYGSTTTYGQVARAINNPESQQAVGAANGANPLPVLIPCHRVIGADGSMTGFGGGIAIKQKLLQLEGIPGAYDQLSLFSNP